MTVFLIVCIAASAAIAASAPAANISEQAALNYRLGTTVFPQHYLLEVTPYFTSEHGKEKFTFDGKVDIWLSATERDVREITLHVDKLNISNNIRLRDAITPLTEIRVTNTDYDERTHKYTLSLESSLVANRRYVLSMLYVGILSSDMNGFYRSSYEENGQIKWLATTQMQATKARRVFPCFDEPQFKATFQVRINRPSHYQPSISNTKIERTEDNVGPGITRETFYRTPIMSTYLLAFIVSEFSVRENVQKTFNVYSRPKALAQTEYSFNIGQTLLATFDEILDYKYYSVPGMTKMSMAALPDFDAGAMENWGLLTYREIALLYDAEESSSMAQQRVATVVSHEQAHMWFGDLVTCQWWSYTWLNEGFARYLQYFVTALVQPDWDMELQFVPDQLQVALGTDSVGGYPLSRDVNTPDEIQETFASISYQKGASVIRMIEHLLGRDKFYVALQQYLKQNQFSTATPEKLYAAFQRQAIGEIDIAAVMGSFTTQSGYPVVNVDVHANRRDVRITQRLFLLQDKDHNNNTKWEVPLSYATKFDNQNFQSTKNQFLLTSKSNALEINFLEQIDWIVFNVQQTGYYRVNYDNITWANIGSALRTSSQQFHVLNRAQIVDDALNLARGGIINFTLALRTIEFLQNETHYVPWLAAFNNLPYIGARFKSSEIGTFKDYILRLLANAYTHLGFEERKNDTRLDVYNRINVLSNACRYGHKQCIANAQKEFNKLTSASYKIPVNIRPVVYCTVVSESTGSTEWNQLWNAFKSSNVAAEQRVLMEALGCTRKPDILKKYLNLILTDDIRLQDKQFAFYATFRDNANTDVVFDFVVENHKKIAESFQAKSMVATILSQLATRFSTREQTDKLKTFVEKNKDEYGPITKGITTAEYNVKWADKNMPEIIAYLKGKPSGGVKSHASLLLVAFVSVSYYLLVQ